MRSISGSVATILIAASLLIGVGIGTQLPTPRPELVSVWDAIAKLFATTGSPTPLPPEPTPTQPGIPFNEWRQTVVAGARSPTPTPTTTPPTPTPTAICGGISWERGSAFIGQRLTVFGPVVDARYAPGSGGRPTFLDLGKKYPQSDRFTIVIWGENRSKFLSVLPSAPEVYYKGKTICVTGLIQDYGGVPEIEATSPTQIREQ